MSNNMRGGGGAVGVCGEQQQRTDWACALCMRFCLCLYPCVLTGIIRSGGYVSERLMTVINILALKGESRFHLLLCICQFRQAKIPQHGGNNGCHHLVRSEVRLRPPVTLMISGMADCVQIHPEVNHSLVPQWMSYSLSRLVLTMSSKWLMLRAFV